MSKFETAAVYDVDNETDRNELYALVNMRLSRMPDRERSMFEQIKIEGKSYREVADSMAISVRSVEYRLNKTVRDLRCHLEQMYA
jgi:RNA polymerase sigma factor (sigma-70 family)